MLFRIPLHAFTSELFLLFLVMLHNRTQTPALTICVGPMFLGTVYMGPTESSLLGDRQISLRPQSKSPGKYCYQLTRAAQISAKGVSMKGRPWFKDPPFLPWAFEPLQYQSKMKVEKTGRQTKWNLWSEVPDIKRLLNYTRNISQIVTVSC